MYDEHGAVRRIAMAGSIDSKAERELAGVGWWEVLAIAIVAVAFIWQWFLR